MTIGSGPGVSAAVEAACFSSGSAGDRPAACTREPRLYPPWPSMGAGIGNAGLSAILIPPAGVAMSLDLAPDHGQNAASPDRKGHRDEGESNARSRGPRLYVLSRSRRAAT